MDYPDNPHGTDTLYSATNNLVAADAVITLTAVANDDYSFKGWYQANINKAGPDDPTYLTE